VRRAPARRAPRKAKAGSRGLTPAECNLTSLSGAAAEARERVQREGGLVLAAYQDPFGTQPLLVAILPIEKVAPTPFQRDLSDMHHKRLAGVIDRTGLFLDPIIAISAPQAGFWTPNGGHRLAATSRRRSKKCSGRCASAPQGSTSKK
jgi:ParB family chromosome partitioning protein